MSETFYRTRNNQCLLLLKSIYYVMSILLDKFRMVCGQYWPSISKVLSNSSALLFIYLFIYLFIFCEIPSYHYTGQLLQLPSYYPSFISERISISIRLLVIQHDCCIEQQLGRFTSERITYCSAPLQNQMALYDFEDNAILPISSSSYDNNMLKILH